MTGKESLGYLIECDNQETDMIRVMDLYSA